MGFSKSSSKREIYNNAIQHQETRKASNKQSNTVSKAAGKRRTKNPKVNRRKEIIKLRAEMNEKQALPQPRIVTYGDCGTHQVKIQGENKASFKNIAIT